MQLFRQQLLLATVLILVGCRPNPTSTSNPAKEQTAETTTNESDDILTSALHQLRPENFGINANPDKPASLLNSWRFKQPEEAEKTPVSVPTGWMTPDEESRINQDKYDLIDCIHIRDAMLNHTVAGYLSDRERDEVKRVGTVVDYVCRNVALWKDNEIEIPLPPFLALQFGRGSVDERAWLCAEILRQLRIDAVILRSAKDAKESTDNWLLGVSIDKKIYLYDLKLGLPIPGDPQQPGHATSTLADILANPDWLQQLAVNDQPYRLTAEDLRGATVHVITTPNYWGRRMQKLEQSLPATEFCVLYDGLSDTEGHTGLLSRVSAAGGWSTDSLKLWSYPHRQNEALRTPVQDVLEELQRMTAVFSVPIPVKIEDGKPVVGTPERKMQKYRIDQVMGKFTEATQRYLSIRHLEVERNPPDIERLNRLAAEDAFYWTCLCKYETADYAAAAEQIQAYTKKYDRKGKWYYPARLLLARSFAELGQFSDAVSTLQRTSADDPYRLGNAILVRRWTEMQGK